MFDMNDLHNEGETLPVKAHIEIIAEQFLVSSYQSHRADHKTNSLTSFRLMRLTVNDTDRNRVKQNLKKAIKSNKNKALKSIHRQTDHTQFNKDSK